MPIPDFVVALRERVGHAPLPLPGVIAVVRDERERVLLVRRSDTGSWALTTGCLEPGEQPAAGAVREVWEETGVEVVVERLLSVEALDLSVAPNGDQVWWLAVGVGCRVVGGAARVNDDESVEVGWFSPGAVPPLPAHQARCLALALMPDARLGWRADQSVGIAGPGTARAADWHDRTTVSHIGPDASCPRRWRLRPNPAGHTAVTESSGGGLRRRRRVGPVRRS
ncbi:NUDIX domain-containing protein [Asanoa sp. WMMD1127]|uniref:NUDIX domain-containing protein n=1 Tax=Asanoa sp. WMMD1127 TaxID=3016107 RepID=UPI0024177EFB|nr:NUDIX domain-containing protein [Asanoa sp. WMMD1127]MDG4823721.1 NUDIX domain-containing protein [Asanoa sp. WMMD1127]